MYLFVRYYIPESGTYVISPLIDKRGSTPLDKKINQGENFTPGWVLL